MKIHLVQHIAILEPAHGEHEPLIYKADTYRGKEEDEWEVQKVVDHQEINNVKWSTTIEQVRQHRERRVKDEGIS